ncbi:MAG TPA: carbohydrate-binding protein [Candidatus Dormibacteraeota bacterium]|nr:carbohydrate-binding protein [Candidatus Dormibacteraeota bacterium]
MLKSILVLSALLLIQSCGSGSSNTQPPPPPPPPAAVPSFWPIAGTYSPTQITLSDSTANPTIYYTTDGSTPTTASTPYTGPVAISSTVTVKAIATASGFSASAVASATYTVPAQNGNGPAVSVAVTTDDQKRQMQAQAATNFTTVSGGGNVIYVDETQTYQPIEGFGAAFTDSAAYLLNEVAQKSALTTTLSDLFTRTGNGIGLSFMRTPMGASDIARTQYSYDDNGGTPDPGLAHFSIAHDQTDVIPIILQARTLNPQMKLMASPWSPPGWMKTSGSLVGGALQSTMYTPFANYFVMYLQAYSAAGINVDYISLQNEPLYVPADYPGMCMPPSPGGSCGAVASPTDQTTALRDYVLPALTTASLTTKVLVYDHNWDAPTYPQAVLTDPTIQASAQVAGSAWHGYGGTPGVMTTIQNYFLAEANYQTEHSGGTFVADQVKSDFEEITQVMRNSGRSYVKWSLALDQTMGPHDGGCGTCTPIVTVNNSTGAVTYDIEYYTLGHFSKYILPGAVRIYSSNTLGLVSAAFLNTDGSKAMVAFNDSTSTQSFSVQWGNQSFAYTLPSLAGATFNWTGAQSGSYKTPATSQTQASSFNSTGGKSTLGDITTFGLQTETTADANGGYDIGSSSDGDYAVYKNVDFGAGVSTVNARLACAGNCGGALEFHLDSLTGTLAASVTIPATAGWQTWTTASASASASGAHDLYVVFKAPPSGTSSLGNLNWFQFN